MRKLSEVSYKGINPTIRFLSHKLITSQRLHLIHLGGWVGYEHMNVEELSDIQTKSSSYRVVENPQTFKLSLLY